MKTQFYPTSTNVFGEIIPARTRPSNYVEPPMCTPRQAIQQPPQQQQEESSSQQPNEEVVK